MNFDSGNFNRKYFICTGFWSDILNVLTWSIMILSPTSKSLSECQLSHQTQCQSFLCSNYKSRRSYGQYSDERVLKDEDVLAYDLTHIWSFDSRIKSRPCWIFQTGPDHFFKNRNSRIVTGIPDLNRWHYR